MMTVQLTAGTAGDAENGAKNKCNIVVNTLHMDNNSIHPPHCVLIRHTVTV